MVKRIILNVNIYNLFIQFLMWFTAQFLNKGLFAMIKDIGLVDDVTATNSTSPTDILMNLFLANFLIFEDADLSFILPREGGDAIFFY